MNTNKVSMTTVKIRDLIQFAEDIAQKSDNELVPIIRSRAKSLAHNPLASPDDIALVLKYHGDRLIGYLGMMAILFYHSNFKRKVFWGCTGAFAKDFWGTNASDKVLNFAKKAVGAFCAGGASPNAQGVYLRNDFLEVKVHPAVKIHINTSRIPFKRIMPRILNFLLKSLLLGKSFEWKEPGYNKRGKKISERIGQSLANHARVHELDAGLSPYIEKKLNEKKKNTFYRSVEVVRWMLETPWWPGEPAANEIEKDYYFYDANKKITFKVFELLNGENQAFGFAIFSIISTRSTSLKLLDHGYENVNALNSIIQLGFRYAAKVNANEIIFPLNSFKQSTIRYFVPFIRTDIRDNYYFWSKEPALKNAMAEVNANVTDGDMPFW